jgi:predicted NAD/FAD-dependent oxidoreductase
LPDSSQKADTGLQTFHAPLAHPLVQALLHQKTFLQDGDGDGFIAPAGASSVCRFCLSEAKAEVEFGTTIKTVVATPNGYVLTPFRGKPVTVAGAIFTGTVAEVNTTHGAISQGWKVELKNPKVKYSKQFTVSLVLEPTLLRLCASCFDKASELKGGGGGSVIESVTWQNGKIPTNTHPVVVVTTTTAFGETEGAQVQATHRSSRANEARLAEIMGRVQKAAFELMAGQSKATLDALQRGVLDSRINFWKYSRVMRTPPTNKKCIVLNAGEGGGLVLAGDYLTQSTFGGCIASSEAAVTAILAVLPRCSVGTSLPSALPLEAPYMLTPLPPQPPPQQRELQPQEQKPPPPRFPESSSLLSQRKQQHVLVVGAGLTGSLASELLVARGYSVEVWEMARGAGGRTTTARPNTTAGAKADMGALVLSGKHPKLQKLATAGILVEVDAGGGHAPVGCRSYVAPDGCNAIAKACLQGAQTRFETRLHHLEIWRNGRHMSATSSGRGPSQQNHAFDAVILAIPPAAVARVKTGTLLRQAGLVLPHIQWESIFSLAMFFSPGGNSERVQQAMQSRHGNGCRQCQAIRYIDKTESAVIGVVSLESLKRTSGKTSANSVNSSTSTIVLHSTQNFWESHRGVNAGGGKGGGRQAEGGSSGGSSKLRGGGREEVQRQLTAEFGRLYPTAAGVAPAEVKLISWKESRLLKSGASLRTPPALVSGPGSPPLAICGDWLVASDFDGCMRSASAAVELLSHRLEKSSVAPGPALASASAPTGSQAKKAKRARQKKKTSRPRLQQGYCNPEG